MNEFVSRALSKLDYEKSSKTKPPNDKKLLHKLTERFIKDEEHPILSVVTTV